MKFMSVFSLRESRREHGGAQFPAKVTNNPQGGSFFTPIVDMFKQSKQREHVGNSSGLGVPSFLGDNPQGGIVYYQIFSKAISDLLTNSHNKDRQKVKQAKKAEKPKADRKPKPARKHKSEPVHKKLHDPTHPILAESFRMAFSLKKREADSSTMVPAMTAKGVKRESSFKITSSRFRESVKSSDGTPTKFRVVLLEEGMGNSHDVYYYTESALESAVDVFNGLKIMADHPTAEEEDIRPERSTRDILGHYENLAVEEAEDGVHQLCGDVDILPSADCAWARARMVRAIENASKFPGRDFIGLSINASGPSEKTPIDDVIKLAPQGAKQKLIDAKNDGIEVVKLVQKINRAASCDLVTEAGAGGKILNSIQGDSDGKKTA